MKERTREKKRKKEFALWVGGTVHMSVSVNCALEKKKKNESPCPLSNELARLTPLSSSAFSAATGQPVCSARKSRAEKESGSSVRKEKEREKMAIVCLLVSI
jgi:hypothetical protein